MSVDIAAMDRLKSASQGLVRSLGDKAVSTAGERLGALTQHLESVAEGGPITKGVAQAGAAVAEGRSPAAGALQGVVSGVKDALPSGGAKGSGGGGGKNATKATNIEEQIDVGVPVRLAYDQWTEFGAFPTFMKKVENVEAPQDAVLDWKAQILEQAPDDLIVWRSKGEKGHVDGAVTFHEVGPNLTRILLVLEYYPQGFMERTGNLWRAQGRRVRAELKHFRRHLMTRTILDPDSVQGWRGTIQEGEVVQTHEEALEEEQDQVDEPSESAEVDQDWAEPEVEDELEEEDEADEAPAEERPRAGRR